MAARKYSKSPSRSPIDWASRPSFLSLYQHVYLPIADASIHAIERSVRPVEGGPRREGDVLTMDVVAPYPVLKAAQRKVWDMFETGEPVELFGHRFKREKGIDLQLFDPVTRDRAFVVVATDRGSRGTFRLYLNERELRLREFSVLAKTGLVVGVSRYDKMIDLEGEEAVKNLRASFARERFDSAVDAYRHANAALRDLYRNQPTLFQSGTAWAVPFWPTCIRVGRHLLGLDEYIKNRGSRWERW